MVVLALRKRRHTFIMVELRQKSRSTLHSLSTTTERRSVIMSGEVMTVCVMGGDDSLESNSASTDSSQTQRAEEPVPSPHVPYETTGDRLFSTPSGEMVAPGPNNVLGNVHY